MPVRQQRQQEARPLPPKEGILPDSGSPDGWVARACSGHPRLRLYNTPIAVLQYARYGMVTVDEIMEFVGECTGAKTIQPDSDIEDDLDCTGDDFSELMEDFSDKYSVDMSTYLWYFHADEEVFINLGRWLFLNPYDRVEKISVTPALLAECANKGKWDIQYPEHKLPEKRWDIFLSPFVFAALVFFTCPGICNNYNN
jgi:hypothetical protein